MPSLVGGMGRRKGGPSGWNGQGQNRNARKSSGGSAKGNGRAARSFAAVAGLVLCSIGLLGLSSHSLDAGNVSSYFWRYTSNMASTKKRGTGLAARILLAAEKYEFKDDDSSGDNATSSTEYSSVGERQMLKIVSACKVLFKSQHISLYCTVCCSMDVLMCNISILYIRALLLISIDVPIQYIYRRMSLPVEEEGMDQTAQIPCQLPYHRQQT